MSLPEAPEPIGYLVIWETEPGDLGGVTFTPDRAEAHRLYENAVHLDAEAIDRAPFTAAPGMVTLANVYSASEFYERISQDAIPWQAT